MNKTTIVIVSIVGLVIIIALFFVSGVGRNPPAPTPVTLEFWGFGDDEAVWRPVLDAFHTQYPAITVAYKRFTEATYEDTLINRLAAGTGPDVFLMKNLWLGRQRDKIAVLPAASSPVSPAQFRATYVDGTAALSADDEGLVGAPLTMDSLALFYNKDIFDAAGIAKPPATWDELVSVSRALTKIAPNGDILQSGAALGAARNISSALELASALMLQQGDAIVGQDGHMDFQHGAGQALQFYASFADRKSPNFSWTGNMQNSLDAFAQGDAAMAFGGSGDIQKIILKNPHLNFAVAPLPQFAGALPRSFGTYTFPAVSRVTPHPNEAWAFVLFAASRDAAALYLGASGHPPARRDLVAAAPAAGASGIFAHQALIARDWFIPDEGAIRRIFGDAIDGIASGAYSPSVALSRISEQVQLLLP